MRRSFTAWARRVAALLALMTVLTFARRLAARAMRRSPRAPAVQAKPVRLGRRSRRREAGTLPPRRASRRPRRERGRRRLAALLPQPRRHRRHRADGGGRRLRGLLDPEGQREGPLADPVSEEKHHETHRHEALAVLLLARWPRFPPARRASPARSRARSRTSRAARSRAWPSPSPARPAARRRRRRTDGNYRFVGLDPGALLGPDASCRLRAAGGRTTSSSPSARKPWSTSRSRSAGWPRRVDVVGEAPVVDTTSSATNNQLSQDLLFNMPIRQGNTATNLLNFAPGINDSAAYGGDASSGNGLLIDGVDTRDPSGGTAWTFYNYNIVEEVQFTGIGAPAEYGAFTGAIVNTITKSGGNQFARPLRHDLHEEQLRQQERPGEFIAREPQPGPGGQDRTSWSTSPPSSAAPSSRTSCSSSPAPSATRRTTTPSAPARVCNEASDRFNGKLTWQPGRQRQRRRPPPVRQLQHHRPRGLQRRSSTPTRSRTARTPRSSSGWRRGATSSGRRPSRR